VTTLLPQGPAELLVPLRRMGLLAEGEEAALTPLTGGVASDIVLVETAERRFVAKRALARLRVAADWRAPVERNAYEVAWLRLADAVVPGCAPLVLGTDAEAGVFAMAYLPPATHPVWKSELFAGRIDPGFAAQVGERMAALHTATAGDPSVAAGFDTLHIFGPIRLEAYLEAAAARHPDLSARLLALSRGTAERRVALVHGDVSPKNILVGPDGPVFLDAECAWYGDPAFDLAFCLNHLLLKMVVMGESRDRLAAAFDALAGGYRAGALFEDPAALEGRASALLPGLFLARIDGKSPVDYIDKEADRQRVRAIAAPLISDPPPTLGAVREAVLGGLSA
jgi:aminoglycoside phosphotransferase (APT) family kinase protein